MASNSISDFIEFTLALLASGALAGLLAGLFGVTGGFVIVPVLYPLMSTLGVQGTVVVYVAVGLSLALVGVTLARAALEQRTAQRLAPLTPRAGGGAQGGAATSALARSASAGLAGGGALSFPGRAEAGLGAMRKAWLWPVPAGAVAASVVVAALQAPEIEMLFAASILLLAFKVLFIGGRVHLMAPAAPRPAAPAGLWGQARAWVIDPLGRLLHWVTSTPTGVCTLLATPGVLGLAMAGWGAPTLPVGALGYANALGMVLVLVTSAVLAPVGAELSGQFSKRVLELSLGLFLLLVAGQLMFELLI